MTDILIRRGVAHYLGFKPPKKPANLTENQERYYEWVMRDMQGQPLITPEFVIQNDDDLWLAIISKHRPAVARYKESVGKDPAGIRKITRTIVENDCFFFLDLKSAIRLMMKRYESERDYFRLVKEYYKESVRKSVTAIPASFFGLEENDYKFLRQQLDVETARFQFHYAAYEIFRTKQFYLAGIHDSMVNDKEFIYSTLLTMSKSPEAYFNMLRQETADVLNAIHYDFANDADANGNKIIDYPWFRLTFEATPQGNVKVHIRANTKPYATIYTMEKRHQLLQDKNTGKRALKLDDLPDIHLENDEQLQTIMKIVGLKM